jgi:hypothetical protein
MSRSVVTGMLVLGVVTSSGCAGNAAQQGTSAGRIAERTTSQRRTLASGTHIQAMILDSLSSRINKSGETVRGVVSSDVRDDRGRIIIPASSPVVLIIDRLDPGSDQGEPDGRLSLVVTSVSVNGESYPVTARLDSVTHQMVGRGITKDEAARIAAGTVIGAVAGQVIGKNTQSTVVGGAIGAVAGTAVALRYAYRDVIVSAGTPIVFTLTQSLNMSAR